MKNVYIKKFETFVIEDMDPVETKSAKQFYNKLEKDIKEFSNKKTVLHNIYMTYKDDKDLYRLLNVQKMIDPRSVTNTQTTQQKETTPTFLNELFGLYAQICGKDRDVKDTNDQIKNAKSDEDRKPFQDKIKKLQSEIVDINKNITTSLNNMNVKLKKYKADIDKSRQNLI